MASVTFPVELGGDGSTVTDDANPITGLRNGGWRTRFVPCLTNTVAIANQVATRTIFGSDTSVTSNSIGVGSKVFATAGLLRWAAGMYVTVARTSAPTASNMYGQVTAYNAFTSQVTINITSVVGSGTFTDWTIAIAPPGLAAFSFTGATTIAVNSTSDALRVTQTGTGNALVVEDSANPDATPFVVTADGRVVAGYTSTITIPSGDGGLYGAGIEAIGASGGAASLGAVLYNNAAAGFAGAVSLAKSNSATVGTQALVASADLLGAIYFSGSDGTNFIRGAQILANVDGTPGTNDMPGRLVFSTTADGASTPTERMRIDNAGRVGIGRTPGNDGTLYVTGSPVNAYSYNINNAPTYGSTVTAEGVGYIATVNTAAAAFTLNAVQHYRVAQGTKGAGSTITNLVGYHCDPLTNGTNNFGFYSTVASGTGRYNFYAAGTADNYFAGAVGIGGLLYAGASVVVSKSITGSTAGIGIAVDGTAQSDVTNSCQSFLSQAKTAAATFTLGNYYGFRAQQSSFGAGSTITNQYGFAADSSLTGATNNFGFHSNIASGAGRWNFYAGGTAANFFQGTVATGTSLSVGTSTQNWVHTVYETGNAFTQYINSVSGTANTDGLLVGLTSSDAVVRNRESGNVFLYTADTIRFTVTSTGNLHGTSGTTAMTDGFFYIPSAAGAPSGVPTAIAGRVPMYYDTTNNNFYVYNGAWKKVLLA